MVMDRRAGQADGLARRSLAMHARHRLKTDAGARVRSDFVCVDPQPMHVASTRARQAMTHALQPMHNEVSITIPHRAPFCGSSGKNDASATFFSLASEWN